MKSVITALAIACVIIFGGMKITSEMEEMSQNMIEKCDIISQSAESGDFDTAEMTADEIDRYLKEKYILLAVCMDHNEIDKIEMNLSQLQAYAAEKQKADSLACSNTLKGLFEHMPKDYRLKPENIL